MDLGDRRTGLASGDSATGVVSPLTVIEVELQHGGGAPLLEAVARAVEDQLGDNPRLQRGEVVIGVPLNMDGSAGPRVKIVRAFAARLQSRLGRAVHEQDERLTSVQADWDMAQTGLTHQQKKERRDALAAAAILGDFLEARKNAPAEPTDDRGVW
ncbi:MAG: Holliday junction resolvase RuvX [Planctomycetota bacterium]